MERNNNVRSALAGGVMIVGLAVLLLVDSISFWPWILVVFGLAGLPAGLERGGAVAGFLPFLWLLAFAILIELWWPGVLVLVGATFLAGIAARR